MAKKKPGESEEDKPSGKRPRTRKPAPKTKSSSKTKSASTSPTQAGKRSVKQPKSAGAKKPKVKTKGQKPPKAKKPSTTKAKPKTPSTRGVPPQPPAAPLPPAGGALEVVAGDGSAPELMVLAAPAGGGTVIRGAAGKGTVSIACLDVGDGVNAFRSLLTAAHVVNFEEGSEVTVDDERVGEVSLLGTSGGVPIDVALVRLDDGIPTHPGVQTAAAKFPIQAINRPAEIDDIVIHGGPHGKNGTVEGRITTLDAAQTISLNTLNQQVDYSVFGLMAIEPTDLTVPFAKGGDSGSLVMRQNASGKFDAVGLLVAVDKSGVGYAQHMADQPGGALGVVSLMSIRKLP